MNTIPSVRPGWRIGLARLFGVAAIVAGAAAGSAWDAHAASEPVSSGGPATFRRLTEDQYKRAIAQVFGADIKVPGRFEPRVREEGLLAVGDSQVVITPTGFEQYAIRSREISAQVLDDAHRKQFLDCDSPAPDKFDDACAKQFLGKYGRLLFRRPLTDKEMISVLGEARHGTEASGSFYKGLGAGLGALLASPPFVFRIETSEPDPDHPGTMRLDDYSLASRISFLLWDAPPDSELLDAAASGALHKKDGLEKQVDRMMASPQFDQGVRAFFSDMFGYAQFDGLSKDAALFPIFNPKLRDDAEEESLRTIVDHLVTEDKDYRDLFTTKKTFVSRWLGALYGVQVDYRAFDGWMPYTFPANDPHAGILTLPAFLMLDPEHEGKTSPTIRGKNLRELFLCQKIPAPPGNVDFSKFNDPKNPNPTVRERLTAHRDNPTCAGCHSIMDPIGLSVEDFNAVGQFRTSENGVPIDVTGTFDGKPYKDLIGLEKLLAASPQLPNCLVQRVYQYGVGRQIAPGEHDWVEYLDQRFAKDGYKFPKLIREVATSPAFQAVSADTVASN